MSDVELVIKINEKAYNALTHAEFDANLVVNEMRKAIANGTPLPKGHGRIIVESKITKTCWEKFETKPPLDTILYKNRDIVFKGSNAPTIIEADKAESEE